MSSILVKVLMKYRNWSAMILAIGWLLHDVLITNDNTIFSVCVVREKICCNCFTLQFIRCRSVGFNLNFLYVIFRQSFFLDPL